MFGAATYVSSISDLHFIMNGSLYPFVIYGTLFYMNLEGNKFLVKPILLRWYKRIINN